MDENLLLFLDHRFDSRLYRAVLGQKKTKHARGGECPLALSPPSILLRALPYTLRFEPSSPWEPSCPGRPPKNYRDSRTPICWGLAVTNVAGQANTVLVFESPLVIAALPHELICGDGLVIAESFTPTQYALLCKTLSILIWWASHTKRSFKPCILSHALSRPTLL